MICAPHCFGEHFAEWKRLDEKDKGSVAAEVLLNGMLAHDRLLDIAENYILFDESRAYRHGLRASEVGLLRTDDIDFRARRIVVHRLDRRDRLACAHNARRAHRPTKSRLCGCD